MSEECGMRDPQMANKPSARISAKVLSRSVGAVSVVLLLALAIFAARALSSQKKNPALPASGDQTWTVQRGPLVISLLAPGSTKAKSTTEIKCLLQGRDVKIIWIVDEGNVVKKGDKLVELESPGLKEDYVKQQISVAQAQADYSARLQDVAIQESKNRSDLVTAQNKFDMAVLDQEKYIKGDYKQKLREAELAIKLAEAELKRTRDKLAGTEKLLKKGYVNRGEFEADQLDVTKQEIELDKALSQKELLEKYEYKREVSRLETEKEGAKEELVRTKRSNASELQNKQTAADAAKSKLGLEKVQMKNLQEQMDSTVVYAPQGGMVVYSQEDRRGDAERIAVGVQVRNQQKLIDLPDFSAWQVETARS